jgi:peptide deformylase
MMRIMTYPDPVLKQTAKAITTFDLNLEKLANDMIETMYAAPGVGLAANQVGVLKQIAVIDTDYKDVIGKNPRVIINPQIQELSEPISFREGCLSVPHFSEDVRRFNKVTLKYQDLKGNEQTLKAEGLLAVAIQHEVDHLNGKLYIDRLSPVKKDLLKKRIRKSLP